MKVDWTHHKKQTNNNPPSPKTQTNKQTNKTPPPKKNKPKKQRAENVIRQALDLNPEGESRVVRKKKTWRHSIEEGMKTAGTTWGAIKKVAQNQVQARLINDEAFSALCGALVGSSGCSRNKSQKKSHGRGRNHLWKWKFEENS